MKLDPGFHREYHFGGNRTLKSWGLVGGGVALILVAVVGFLTTLWTRSGQIQLQLTTTLPMIFAIGLFGAAYTLWRAPKSVIINAAGVTIASSREQRQYGWDDVAWSEVGPASMSGQKRLRLYGRDGKTLVSLPQQLNGFDELVALFKSREEQAPSMHATAVQWKHARRRAVFLLFGGVLALLLGGVNAHFAWQEHANQKLLETSGAPGTAQIVRKFTAPDGVTRRIEFKVTDPSGAAHVHNVEIEPAYWTILPENAELPVTTVPGRPDIARLAFGEVSSNDPDPKVMGIVSGALMLIGLGILVAAVISYRGIDVHFESGKGLHIRRIGAQRAPTQQA